MTPIFEGQPLKTRPFPIKTGVIWVPGIYNVSTLKNCARRKKPQECVAFWTGMLGKRCLQVLGLIYSLYGEKNTSFWVHDRHPYLEVHHT